MAVSDGVSDGVSGGVSNGSPVELGVAELARRIDALAAAPAVAGTRVRVRAEDAVAMIRQGYPQDTRRSGS